MLRQFDVAVDLGTPTDAVRRVLAASGKVRALVSTMAVPFGSEHSFLQVAADDEALPFANGSLDLVVSALALQFVNDLPGTLIQIRRALKPDGLLLAALVGGESLAELREAIATAEIEIEGGVSPHIAPFADVRELGALLQRAGFALPVIDNERLVVRYDSVSALVRDLRLMGATNVLSERRRKPLKTRNGETDGRNLQRAVCLQRWSLARKFRNHLVVRLGAAREPAKVTQAGFGRAPTIRRPEHHRNIGRGKTRAIALEECHQVGDQRHVGRRHFVLAQFVRSHPGESLPFGRSDGSVPLAANIKRHQDVKVGVAVAGKGEGRETIVADGYCEFFP